METPVSPESLESRIAPAALGGLGDDLAGPLPAAAIAQPVDAEAPPLMVDENVVVSPRSGNIDLGTVVPDITTVPVDGSIIGDLSVAASEAILQSASTLNVLATSALGGEPTGVGTLGVGDGDGAQAGIDTGESALESSATNIADLVLIKTGGFASANPESLLIVKV
jgi:hypothetical protein